MFKDSRILFFLLNSKRCGEFRQVVVHPGTIPDKEEEQVIDLVISSPKKVKGDSPEIVKLLICVFFLNSYYDILSLSQSDMI